MIASLASWAKSSRQKIAFCAFSNFCCHSASSDSDEQKNVIKRFPPESLTKRQIKSVLNVDYPSLILASKAKDLY